MVKMRENLVADIHLIMEERGFQRELVGSRYTYLRFGKWGGDGDQNGTRHRSCE